MTDDTNPFALRRYRPTAPAADEQQYDPSAHAAPAEEHEEPAVYMPAIHIPVHADERISAPLLSDFSEQQPEIIAHDATQQPGQPGTQYPTDSIPHASGIIASSEYVAPNPKRTRRSPASVKPGRGRKPGAATSDAIADSRFAQLLRHWRAELGITAKAASQILGTKYGTYVTWERGAPCSCDELVLRYIDAERSLARYRLLIDAGFLKPQRVHVEDNRQPDVVYADSGLGAMEHGEKAHTARAIITTPARDDGIPSYMLDESMSPDDKIAMRKSIATDAMQDFVKHVADEVYEATSEVPAFKLPESHIPWPTDKSAIGLTVKNPNRHNQRVTQVTPRMLAGAYDVIALTDPEAAEAHKAEMATALENAAKSE